MKPSLRKTTDYIVIHCSATRPSQDIGAAEIARWHRQRGFLTIGYHIVIRRDGTIEDGRKPLESIGAHVQGWNHCSVGICLVGGVSERNVNKAQDNFTPEQMQSLALVVAGLKNRWPNAKVQGHRDFPEVAKACPSFDAVAWAERNGFGSEDGN